MPRSTNAVAKVRAGKALALFHADKCPKEIADEIGVSLSGAHHLLRACGITKLYVTPGERALVMARRASVATVQNKAA